MNIVIWDNKNYTYYKNIKLSWDQAQAWLGLFDLDSSLIQIRFENQVQVQPE